MIDRIEDILKGLLQKQITITIKNKTVKRGQLIIFRHVGCFIRLELSNGAKREHVEIPFPYAVEGDDNQIFFDYRLATLADGDDATLKLLQTQRQIRDSKYYDRILTIAINNGNE